MQSFTITNVTLKNGTGYSVEFVNPANHTDVYAIGPNFEVKASGSELPRVVSDGDLRNLISPHPP